MAYHVLMRTPRMLRNGAGTVMMALPAVDTGRTLPSLVLHALAALHPIKRRKLLRQAAASAFQPDEAC